MKKKMQIYFSHIKMSEQTLKFDHTVIDKEKFHASKRAMPLELVESSRILVSGKFKHN